MHELQAGGGFREAAKQFYYGNRLPIVSAVLSVAGILTGTTSAMAVVQKFAPADIGVQAAGILLAVGACFLHTRHFPLAVVTAFAPVPGLLWAAPVSGGSQFGVVPVLAYGFGLVFATLIAGRKVSHVLGGAAQQQPWRAATVALVLTAVLAVLWFRRTALADAALQAMTDSVLAVLSAAVLLPLALGWLHFDESYVARANRLRERRARFFEWMAQAAIPRWAFSFTGITAVFVALGWYGAQPVLHHGLALRTATLLLVAAVAGSLAGGWRQGLAAALVLSAASLIVVWATVVDPKTAFGAVAVLQVASLATFIVLYQGHQASVWRRRNELSANAERRTLEQSSGPLFAGLAAFVAILPGLILWSGMLPILVGMLAAVGGAAVLFPAVSAALESLVARRHSVEELYGRKKNPGPD